MSYELHIEPQNALRMEDPDALCGRDPSLRVQEGIEATNPKTGEKIRLAGKFLVWTHATSGAAYTMRIGRNRISFRHDAGVLEKAKEIARSLNAQIRGDEGEQY